MFKRNKTPKAPKQNKDIAQTVTLQQEYSRQFDELFADIERTTDAADRVLKLERLVHDIDNADNQIRNKRQFIVDNHTYKKGNLAGSTGYLVGGAAAAVPIFILAPPLAGLIIIGGVIGAMTGKISTEGRIKKKGEKMVAQDADLNAFQALITEKRAQAAGMLDETVKNCDLEKLPLCPRFHEALGSCAPLRERFAKASVDAAKQALEEKAALEEQQKPVNKKLRISRPPKNE